MRNETHTSIEPHGGSVSVVSSDETWTKLERLTKEANDGFVNGTITYSDVVNEILFATKLDIRGIQAKHTHFRKSSLLTGSFLKNS